MHKYLLSNHVYVSVLPEAAIFLDLARNAYIGIGADEAGALQGVIAGWPRSTTATVTAESVTELLAGLRERHLITTDRHCGRQFSPPTIERTTDTLIEWDKMNPEVVRPTHVVRLAAAFGWARLSLRCRSMLAIVNDVPGTRDLAVTAENSQRQLLLDLVSAYFHIRPFFFGHRSRCLLDSLTLKRFLCSYGLNPTWVVGVRATPFLAHSWVQYGDRVLNDRPEKISNYTPIFAL
jgi:hypothetical protein